MTLLKKRWRDTKDDHCKTTHRTTESEKVIILRWNITQQMVSSKSPRNIPLNKAVSQMVQKIGTTRPTYGTRKMAAATSKRVGICSKQKANQESLIN